MTQEEWDKRLAQWMDEYRREWEKLLQTMIANQRIAELTAPKVRECADLGPDEEGD